MENNVNTTQSKKSNNFFLRVISSIILLPVIIWVSLGGGFLYFLLLLAAACIACKEFDYMCGRWSFGLDTMSFMTFVCLSITSFYMSSLLLGFILLIIGAYVTYFAVKFRSASEAHLSEVIPSYINRPLLLAIGQLYIGMAFSSLAYLHTYDPSNITVLWIFGLVVCSDVSAYIFGSLIKGAKLAPFISPGKTWSGFIAAIIITFLVSYVVSSVVNIKNILDISIFGAVVAIVAHAGDLMESGLKRYVNVKDSGNLIPGHGGILDRIDALMLVAIFSFIVSLVIDKNILLI